MRIIPLIVATLLAVGCAQVVQSEGAPAIGTDLRSLARESDLVVIGTAEAAGGTRNLARQVNDTTREATDIVILGQDFSVRVDSILKGQPLVDPRIIVSLPRWHGVPGQQVGTDREYLPFEIGARYVLFLKPLRDGTAGYGQSLEPYRFKIEADRTRPESVWPDATRYFPEKALDALVRDIESAQK